MKMSRIKSVGFTVKALMLKQERPWDSWLSATITSRGARYSGKRYGGQNKRQDIDSRFIKYLSVPDL